MWWSALGAMLIATSGQAVHAEPGRADFTYLSDLAAEGFEPFAASAAGNASFGMKRDAEMYLCFIADDPAVSAERQAILVEEVTGKNPDREVSNIPVVCVATQ